MELTRHASGAGVCATGASAPGVCGSGGVMPVVPGRPGPVCAGRHGVPTAADVKFLIALSDVEVGASPVYCVAACTLPSVLQTLALAESW